MKVKNGVKENIAVETEKMNKTDKRSATLQLLGRRQLCQENSIGYATQVRGTRGKGY